MHVLLKGDENREKRWGQLPSALSTSDSGPESVTLRHAYSPGEVTLGVTSGAIRTRPPPCTSNSFQRFGLTLAPFIAPAQKTLISCVKLPSFS